MVNIDLNTEEIEFLDEALRYGEDDYIRRAHQYAKESKRDHDKKYQQYFENKKNMFVLMRAKLISAKDTPLYSQINEFVDKQGVKDFAKYQQQKKQKEQTEFKPKHDSEETQNKNTFPIMAPSLKRPKTHFKNTPSIFQGFEDALNSLDTNDDKDTQLTHDYLENFGVFYSEEDKEKNKPVSDEEIEQMKKRVHERKERFKKTFQSMKVLDKDEWHVCTTPDPDNNNEMKEVDDRDKKILNDNTRVFECAACGQKRIRSNRRRAYHARIFKHPVLMEINNNELICSPCRSWDYDLMVRRRKNRRNLMLKDGRILSAKNVIAFLDNEGDNFR